MSDSHQQESCSCRRCFYQFFGGFRYVFTALQHITWQDPNATGRALFIIRDKEWVKHESSSVIRQQLSAFSGTLARLYAWTHLVLSRDPLLSVMTPAACGLSLAQQAWTQCCGSMRGSSLQLQAWPCSCVTWMGDDEKSSSRVPSCIYHNKNQIKY